MERPPLVRGPGSRRVVRVGLAVGVFVLLAGCGDGGTGAGPTTEVSTVATEEPALFHVVLDDSVVVSGTAWCDLSEDGVWRGRTQAADTRYLATRPS